MQWFIFWIAVGIIAAVAELLTVQLVAIWFCVSAVVSLITAYAGVDPKLQILVFLILSIILILATRPLVKRVLIPKLHRTNTDRLIGMKCVITEDIDNINNRGQAKVNGQDWTARAADDSLIIKKGETALIKAISGVKLIVEPLEENKKETE